jgi:hypothetical protein
MHCRTARRRIFLYKPDELSQGERLRLERHLGRCSECAAEAMVGHRTRQMVAALRDQEPILNNPEDLTASIMRAVESERQRTWSGQRQTRMPSAAVWRIQLACSLTLLLIALAFVAQTYSDTRKVYALEQRLRGEGGTQAVSTGVLPEQLRAEVLSVPELLRLIQWIDQSNRARQRTLMDHIARNYPGLASINLDNGVDERERAILATEGETLLKELESIVRTGGKNNEK